MNMCAPIDGKLDPHLINQKGVFRFRVEEFFNTCHIINKHKQRGIMANITYSIEDEIVQITIDDGKANAMKRLIPYAALINPLNHQLSWWSQLC